MTLNANKLKNTSNKEFKRPEPLEAGSYPARLVQIITEGVQKNRPFKGEEKPPQLSMRLTYEILDEFLKDEDGNDLLDKPRWIGEVIPFYSLKADLAKSTKRYYALDPESKAEGDWSKLISAPCMVTLIVEESKKEKGKFYENIASVSAMRPKEASKAPELKNEGKVFDFYEPDLEVFESLPDWIKDRIKGAVDFDGGALQAMLGGSGKKVAQKAKASVAASQEVDEGTDTDDENW